MADVTDIAVMTRDHSGENFGEEKFRLVVEACPSGMLMTDGAGIIVLANTAAERLFGYRREQLVGRKIELLIPQRLRGEHHKQRAIFALHPHARRLQPNRELFGLRSDATEFPVEVWLNPIHSGDGLFVLSVIVDISERKRMDRLKDEFVSTVSHELRTPLTSISGSLGLLLGGAVGKLPDAARRLLGIAQTNSTRLVRLVNDILDIEKIEAGQVAFNFKRIDVRALAGQVIEADRAFADGFGVRVRLDAAVDAAEIYADPDRLAQVISNLLSNAVKFSPRDSEVTVTIGRCADCVRISVRDRGDGIPPQFKPRVFDKFAQADASDARQKGGTGLGLSIVREIVTRLHGSVDFEDAADGGTVFHVELPDAAHIAGRELDAERSPDAVRILFCENDPDAAMALRDGLRPLGYATDFAHDPAAAIARTRSNAYAAIIVDFELPDAGGMRFICQLREQPEIYKTPLVIVTGEGGAVNRPEAASLNIIAWIAKPVDPYQLAQVLDGAVARGAHGRPCILHVDDDHDVLDLVALSLQSSARVVSADSLEEARVALLAHDVDLVVLDITLGPRSGLDLLPELKNRDGAPIPVIVFSAHVAELVADPQVQPRLNKSQSSLDELVDAVRDRLMLRSLRAEEDLP